ncbi:MAG: o-succinylbenzoate synthase [Bacteroidales bacterium]
MLRAAIQKLELKFITPGQTSRGTLYTKPSWFFILENDGHRGMGECSVIPGLNPEYDHTYESRIYQVAEQINRGNLPTLSSLDHYPSIRFGLETALADLAQAQPGILFPSAFTRGDQGIAINGLIWMGSKEEMQQRISEKLNQGFKVLKLKVGALDFREELSLLQAIRSQFSESELEIRLDANGAFGPAEALEKLKRLSEFHIHSIEQPIKPGQWETMAHLCKTSPIPIALDEELIGLIATEQKQQMLDTIQPQYIILKPSLLGGPDHSLQWIQMAENTNAGWWATSALESNVGLNAIAQWVFVQNPSMVQGLGTGQVFSNNLSSPLELRGPRLYFNPDQTFSTDELN